MNHDEPNQLWPPGMSAAQPGLIAIESGQSITWKTAESEPKKNTHLEEKLGAPAQRCMFCQNHGFRRAGEVFVYKKP
jgi:hypothetical protein